MRPPLPLNGGCRCGRVRLRISQPPLLTMACHCSGCQRMSASAFSLSAAIPADGFELISGETELAGVHGDAQHHACGWCKSWLFTRADGFDFLNLRPTMLDDCGWFTPYLETWTREKLPWAATPAVRSFETVPDMDAFLGLTQEYLEWSGGRA